MKSPLRYQVTQYDCGPTTMTNAILYLFEREEIPPDLVRHIGLCTLDSYDRNGHCGPPAGPADGPATAFPVPGTGETPRFAVPGVLCHM